MNDSDFAIMDLAQIDLVDNEYKVQLQCVDDFE